MTLTRSDFATFFAAVHKGREPFQWQERLLDQVLTGQWPDTIDAPTGAGKTAVIDVHVFAVALGAAAGAVTVPRRLAVVVDRRALVDDQYTHSRAIADALLRAETGVLRSVADALLSLSTHHEPEPLRTALLRGAMPPSRRWRDDPTACVVVHATPDMWGSRLLLRGYGSSREARPVEAGLLAYDSVVVVDEAHLSRQLVRTARRVAELQNAAPESIGRPVQVVATTATPGAAAGVVVGVEEADFAIDEALSERLCTPKPVTLLPVETWPVRGAATKTAHRTLADSAARLHQEFGATVGCVVNTVAAATAVFEDLEKRGLSAVLLCGRRRPADLADLPEGLLTIDGNSSVDVVVATQTIEVGVDVSFTAMVTELAPGSALAQRAGRVNRLGERETRVEVVVPVAKVAERGSVYEHADLTAGLDWLRSRVEVADGLAPWSLRETPPPGRAVNRTPAIPVSADDDWQFLRLELGDTWQLARTSKIAAIRTAETTVAEPRIDLWLADDLDDDRDVGVLVRDGIDLDRTAAVQMIELLSPQRHEVFPTPMSTVKELLAGLLPDPAVVAVRVRGSEVSLLDPSSISDDSRAEVDLQTGDLVILDASRPVTRNHVVDADPKDAVKDVMERVIGKPGSGSTVMTLTNDDRAVVDALTETRPLTAQQRPMLVELLSARALTAPERAFARAAELIGQCRFDDHDKAKPVDVVVRRIVLRQQQAEDHDPADADPDADVRYRVMIVDRRRATADGEIRQTWASKKSVPLSVHRDAVAIRAAVVAGRVGLPSDLIEALQLAGLHHDDGKADSRFQIMLGRKDTDEVLAKSARQTPKQLAEALTRSGLPRGWRHEQLSAVHAWEALVDHPHRDLITRLVGTSHGRGRGGFGHTGAQLTGSQHTDEPAAKDLFDDGLWDQIVERTDQRYGVWGTAYLEALLRAADGQVSGEGS